jgi:hypothetical protein
MELDETKVAGVSFFDLGVFLISAAGVAIAWPHFVQKAELSRFLVPHEVQNTAQLPDGIGNSTISQTIVTLGRLALEFLWCFRGIWT